MVLHDMVTEEAHVTLEAAPQIPHCEAQFYTLRVTSFEGVEQVVQTDLTGIDHVPVSIRHCT
jgi:hypothetical protein